MKIYTILILIWMICLIIGCEGVSKKKVNTTTPFSQIFFEGTVRETRALVYEIDLDTVQIKLINGQKKETLFSVADSDREGYLMLTNGGMFHRSGQAVGLFVNEKGQGVSLNTDTASRGNFFMSPNGVFCVDESNQPHILSTQAFQASSLSNPQALQLATQSGPLLLIDGAYHPDFNANSTSRYIRSGVGVTTTQKVLFVLSEEPINFHTFASIFKEKGCTNALYLDGAISKMYIKNSSIPVEHFEEQFYGPIIGVLRK
jgi:uncharacterized protein YigE (DUF2233 family)